MRRNVLLAAALSAVLLPAFAEFTAGQVATGQAQVGVIQGLVTRSGTSEPISEIQVTVTGTAARVNATITGPTGQPLTLTPAMAQQLLDAVASGNPNVVGMPREYVDVAQEVLRSAASNVTPGGPPTPLTAVTDSGGRFTLMGVPAGQVTVRAQGQGYFAPPVNGYYGPNASVAAVVSAEKTADVRLSLMPGGTITGRVVDAAGKPLYETSVQALQRSYTNGIATLTETNAKLTDDRGEYRLYRLPPGEYFLAVNPRRVGTSAAGAAVSTEVPMVTFYPGVGDPAVAAPIVLKGGDELPGYNIQLRTTVTANVSGKVISAIAPGPVLNRDGQVRPPTPMVFIARRDPLGLSIPDPGIGGTISANPDDGSFELRNIPPGPYEVFARLPSASFSDWGGANPPAQATAPWAFGRTEIDVRSGTDLRDVVVRVHHGSDLKGQISVDGRATAADLRVTVLPDDSAANVNDSATAAVVAQIMQFAPNIEPNGSFIVPVLPDGRYRFLIGIGNAPAGGARGGQAPSLPATAYVADIRQRGASVYDNGLVVSGQGIDPVEVLVNTNGSSIEGVVMGPDQKPLSGVTVVLAPPENRRQNPMLYKTVRSDAQGRFVLDRIGPGAYTLFAWENPLAGAWLNAEFLRRYQQRGTAVSVVSGVRTNVTIEPIRD